MRYGPMTLIPALALALGACDLSGGLGTKDASNASGLSGNDAPQATDTCAATCDDHNPCTFDRCNAAGCQHDPLTNDALRCADEVAVTQCEAGVERELSCADACLASGYNAYAACDEVDVGCPCGWVLTSCVPGRSACVGSTRYVAECQSAADAGTSENVWRAYDCNDICRDAGYGPAVTCAADINDFTNAACYCQEKCDPVCPDGSFCFDGACYIPDPTLPPTSSGDECAVDWECGYREACEQGVCVAVECKIDSDCGWCEQCNQNYCDDCGVEPDGSCSCY